MLSLLTYGATFGVAERASTRHEIDLAQDFAQLTVSSSTTIDPGRDPAIDPKTEQEQHPTKGGVIGWLKRLIEHQT